MELKTPILFPSDSETQECFAVRIVLDDETRAEILRQLLKHLNRLGIKEILVSCSLSLLERLFKEDLSLINAFRDFKISLLFSPDLIRFFSDNPGKTRKYLLNPLFCNNQYFKRNQVLGFPVFHFWGKSPEIYELKSIPDMSQIEIPNPEDVHSIFLINNSENNDIDSQVQEITQYFNRQRGNFSEFPYSPKEGAILVLRSYYVCADSKRPFQINYLDSSALAALQKHFKLKLQRMPIHPKNIVYPLDEMFDITQSLNRVDYTPTLEKVLNGIKKTIAYYYYKSGAQPDNFFLKIVFKRFFSSVLKSRLDVISPGVQYLLNADRSLVHVLATDQQFLLAINEKKFHFEAPYFWQSYSIVKQMASEAFANNQTKISVIFSSLLNPEFSLVEQKFYLDVLAHAGATRFWVNIESSRAKSFTDFDSFQLQSYYLNQLVHFLDKGIPSTQILILLPSLDRDKKNYYQSIEILGKAGLPFELISFDQFVSNAFCKIEQEKILFNKQAFSLVLLPAICNIPYRVVKKLFSYFKNGGHIAALCSLPEKVELREKQKKFQKLKDQLWIKDDHSNSISFVQDESGGRSYFIPQLSELKSFLSFYFQKEPIFLEGENVLTKIKETQSSFFVFLTNLSSNQKNEVVLKSKIITQPFIWDFTKKEQHPVYYFNHFSGNMEIPLQFAPWESKLFIFPKKRPQQSQWHLAFCSAKEFILDVTPEGNFFLYLPQDQLGPVDILLENNEKQISTSLMITETHQPLLLPDDHWILETNGKKKAIHLSDIESLLSPDISSIRLRTSFMLKQFLPEFEYLLEFNTLHQRCEVMVNEEKVGSLWYPPFKFRLGKFLKAGENQIDIILNRWERAQADILTPNSKFKIPAPIKIKCFKKFFIKTQND